jgi:hypothetical protein
MESDSKKTERSLQSSARKIQSNGQTFNSRSFSQYIGHLILALLKVKQYGSNGKRVNYWKGNGCNPQNLAGTNETQYSKSAMQDVNPVYPKYKAGMPTNLP